MKRPADRSFDTDNFLAIIVNRWCHGYTCSCTYSSLYDPLDWVFTQTDERSCVTALRPHLYRQLGRGRQPSPGRGIPHCALGGRAGVGKTRVSFCVPQHPGGGL